MKVRSVVVGIVVAALGASLVIWALTARIVWFERHLFFSYCLTSLEMARGAIAVRWGAGIAGAVVAFIGAPVLARWIGRRTLRQVILPMSSTVVAVVAAAVVAEMALRHQASEVVPPPFLRELPLLQRGHPRYGWIWVPLQRIVATVGDHTVTYAINAQGNRARDVRDVPDTSLPTVIINGESVGFGHGLRYDQTLAGLLERDLGVQVVNLSVHGYGTAQQYLRLLDELPRYPRLVAVVTLVLPEQISRDALVLEPHLVLGENGALELAPGRSNLRLARLVRGEPYRGDGPLELTRAVLRTQAAAVQARGATQLFLFTNIGGACLPDEGLPVPRIVDELFERDKLPYAIVTVGPDDTVTSIDPHPNAGVARRMADAVERSLQPRQ
jgi:hypothetical protein